MSRLMILCGVMSVGVVACGNPSESSLPSNDESATPSIGSRNDEIVGGTATSAYPAVGVLASKSGYCTGTLISARTVLTAAHCLEEDAASSFVFTGGPDFRKPEWTVKATGGVQHPAWDSQKLENDIALIFLAEDAPVEPMATANAFPSSLVGQKLLFVGYGITNATTQAGFGTKRQVSITITEVADTQFAYGDKGKNTCNGDSGGPAFVSVGGQLQVAGVTSYGDAKCTKYGIDTRVDAFDAFISSNLR